MHRVAASSKAWGGSPSRAATHLLHLLESRRAEEVLGAVQLRRAGAAAEGAAVALVGTEQREVVRARGGGEGAARLRGRLTLVEGREPRRAHREPRGDDEHGVEAAQHAREEEHLADAHVARQRRQVVPQWCEALLRVECLQLRQSHHRRAHRVGCGRLERLGEKVLDLAELEQLDLQAELVQRRAMHLGQLVRREAGAPLVRVHVEALTRLHAAGAATCVAAVAEVEQCTRSAGIRLVWARLDREARWHRHDTCTCCSHSARMVRACARHSGRRARRWRREAEEIHASTSCGKLLSAS